VDWCWKSFWEYGDASPEVSGPILTEYWLSRARPDGSAERESGAILKLKSNHGLFYLNYLLLLTPQNLFPHHYLLAPIRSSCFVNLLELLDQLLTLGNCCLHHLYCQFSLRHSQSPDAHNQLIILLLKPDLSHSGSNSNDFSSVYWVGTIQ
jgi:hypothetical protein